jgi:hypothetical protein
MLSQGARESDSCPAAALLRAKGCKSDAPEGHAAASFDALCVAVSNRMSRQREAFMLYGTCRAVPRCWTAHGKADRRRGEPEGSAAIGGRDAALAGVERSREIGDEICRRLQTH